MPRVNRLRRAREHRNLTHAQELELLIGPSGKSAFLDEATRRQAWIEHKAELMALLPPDGRGWGWVRYEASGSVASKGGRITTALRRIDGAKAAELAARRAARRVGARR